MITRLRNSPKANVTIEEGRKHLKARLINQSESKAFTQKEQDAYAKPVHFLNHYRFSDDEHYRLLVDHHKARIEVWRSQSANDRFINQRI